jgi:acetyl-CoA C-acetyltransferase
MLKEIFIVDAVRTPIGKFGGSLKDIPASKLGTIATKALIERNNINPQLINSLVLGNVSAAGDIYNAARNIAINSGMNDDCSAHTVNRLCGSGMQAIISSIMEMETENADMTLAVGAENMSRIPYILPNSRWGVKMGAFTALDAMSEILSDPFDKYPAGILGENLAEEYKISREEQDKFALSSQEKYDNAHKENLFKDQLIPVEVGGKVGTFSKDEHARMTTLEDLSKLKPVFKKDGTVTAGNASGINDGAASVLLATKEKVDELKLKPLAKIISYGSGGVNHNLMGYAPVLSSKKALEKINMNIDQMDLIEANEAFASQVLAVGKGLEWNPDKVNVNGGAIALGHPLGMSGVRITVMLAHEMRRRNVKYGLATICIGGGMGLTLILENPWKE